MEYRRRYLPLTDVHEGMVLGAPLVLTEHGVITFSLPADHELTESNLRQMQRRNAEFVCVRETDERSDEERAADAARVEARLQRIFRMADLADPMAAGLYEAVLAYRRN